VKAAPLSAVILCGCLAGERPEPACTIDCDPPVAPPPAEPTIGSPVPFEDEDVAVPEADCIAPDIGTTRARLLTRFEYDNTVRDLLGDKTRPARSFPAENRILAFDNDSRTHIVSPLLVEQYQGAAEGLARRAVAQNLSSLLPCSPRGGAMACGKRFVDTFVRRAFRAPLETEDAAPYYELFKIGLETSGFETGVEMVIEAVLQSPQFLYRIESSTPGDDPAPLYPHELASRLSYFLWGSMPDDRLLAAPLSTPRQIEAEARRLLADGRAREATAHFFLQWLDLEGLGSIPKDPNAFPEFRDSMRRSWVWSMEQYFEHVVFGRGTIDALFTEPVVFVDDVLAPLYAEITPETHAGLLTQPAMMAKLALPNQSSPIRRGVFVRERILCQLLPSPPNNVDIVPPDPDPNATTRERFAEHTSNPTCSGCHALIDPIGFGFEKYDALGRYRELENGRPIDATGELIATEEAHLQGPFDGAIELSERLARSSEARTCLVTQLFRFAMGRAEAEQDECTLRRLENTLIASGGRIDELLVAMTVAHAFRMKREEGP
jgi:hypothetical protein